MVDGDTLKVDRSGRTVKVRLIGIDTPETSDPRKPVQCFGREASARAHELLDGQQVFLESDPSQDSVDKYGRTLAYVYVGDLLVNRAMIEQGYAHEYTYDTPYRYQAEFRAAEAAARDGDHGLWSPSSCNGDTEQAAAPAVPSARPTASPQPSSGGSGTSTGGSSSGSSSTSYANCSEARAAGAAPINEGEPGYAAHLDRDGDGVACE